MRKVSQLPAAISTMVCNRYFQVSKAPGALRLAGSNRDETIERFRVSGVSSSRALTPEH